MPRRPTVIRAHQNLPHRPTRPSAEALSALFGGCVQLGSVCSPNGAACCVGSCQLYKPYPNWPGQWYCDVMAGGGE